MKSVVLGKVIENVYSVDPKTTTIKDEHGEEKVVYTAKPVLNKESKIKEWRYILHFEGEPKYNTKNSYYYLKMYIASYDSDYSKYLNISDNEEVAIIEEIFRADLNELHLHSNKVMEEIDVNKESSTYEYEAYIEQFNKMMNTSNKAMKDYCDLHGLDYRKADCEKVFSLVYPDKEYEIKNGKMICKENTFKYKLAQIDDIKVATAIYNHCHAQATCDAIEKADVSEINAIKG